LPQNYIHSYASTLVSIGSFLLGSYLTLLIARQTRHINKHSRIFLASCFLVQALLLTLAAFLALFHLVPDNPTGAQAAYRNIRILTDIPPLAFQFGVQMATSRILGFGELPSNVLTSSYTDLMGDPKLFKLEWNPKRERRIGSIVLVLLGGILGAWMMRAGCRVFVSIWVAVGLKLVTAVGILGVMPRKEELPVAKDESV
jgi:hypothetical protein